MLGVLDNAAIRVWMGSGSESAKIASQDGMTAETRRREVSYTQAEKPSSTTSYRTDMRKVVLESEVQTLRGPTPKDPTVRAYICASHLPGPVLAQQNFSQFFRFMNALPEIPAFRPRPAHELWLEPFSDEELQSMDALFEPEGRRGRNVQRLSSQEPSPKPPHQRRLPS